MSATTNTWLTRLFLIVCITIYGVHLWIIVQNAVNVPFWDEWGILSPDALPAGFTFSWIFKQDAEHRMVPTKLLAWGLFYVSGHNHVLSIVITYALYGLLLACIGLFARRMAPHVPLWVTLAFILFLLSPINWENNFWGLQSTFRFTLLFTLLAVHLLFDKPQTNRQLALGASMGVLAMYSFLAGLVAVCV